MAATLVSHLLGYAARDQPCRPVFGFWLTLGELESKAHPVLTPSNGPVL